MIFTSRTRQGAGLLLVFAGVLASLQGGVGWVVLGVAAVGAGAVVFVRAYKESHD